MVLLVLVAGLMPIVSLISAGFPGGALAVAGGLALLAALSRRRLLAAERGHEGRTGRTGSASASTHGGEPPGRAN
jgi:hypothetical protein